MKTERFSKGTHTTYDRRPLGERFTSFDVGDVEQRREYEPLDRTVTRPRDKNLGRYLLARQRGMDRAVSAQEGPTPENAEARFAKPPFPQGDKPRDEDEGQYPREVRRYKNGGPVNKSYRRLK